ncbi:MAG: AbrB/MazE/SpoVT family DNA-binding domain-containing protein [Thermoanaerobaculia bacterium]
MKRKLVQAGGSLAVTLPAEVVQELKLKKGQDVEVSVHPITGVVMIHAGVAYLDGGKVTKDFQARVEELARRRAAVYRELAK